MPPRHFVCMAAVGFALSVVLVAACGSAPVPSRTATPEETARLYPELSVVISKAEPPHECTPVGTIQSGGWSAEAAYDGMRKQAAKRHANYVVLDGVAGGVFGRAFACPVSAPPSSGMPPPSGGACVPDCSPGYTCVAGQCVSACNPRCSPGEQCGADRGCHPSR